MKSAILTVDGMSCGHCLNAVSRALSSLAGVRLEAVRIGRVELRYDEGLTDLTRISAAVQSAGYSVSAVAGGQ